VKSALGIGKARDLADDATAEKAVSILGNGADVSAQDTVPFCLWAAAHHRGSYEEALWTTVSGLGDRDTTCAIVGGIVAMSAGVESIPKIWLECENLSPRGSSIHGLARARTSPRRSPQYIVPKI
jgi:ADP-ribosylglycohydrolase